MAEGSNKIRVRLVTPERILLEQDADAVELPAKTGYMEVLYGHAPLLAELGAGDVTIHGASGGDNPENSERFNVSWGFVEVLPDRVTILANDAIAPKNSLTAATTCGTRPGTAKRSTPRPNVSLTRPRPSWPVLGRANHNGQTTAAVHSNLK
jgi:ATP synthase F1 epsilon subunit